jgi:hypothetical protein
MPTTGHPGGDRRLLTKGQIHLKFGTELLALIND